MVELILFVSVCMMSNFVLSISSRYKLVLRRMVDLVLVVVFLIFLVV